MPAYTVMPVPRYTVRFASGAIIMAVRLLLLAILLLPAAGCGQKGPLYIPDEDDGQNTSESG